MTASFILPVAPLQSHACPSRASWSCCSSPPDPETPSTPPNKYNETDKLYLDKVRAKMFNIRKAAAAAAAGGEASSGNDSEAPDIDSVIMANLPDNLDELDDIIYGRGPSNTNQVKLFGGWLDESVAGRKANDPQVAPQNSSDNSEQFSVDSHHKVSLTKQQAIEQANKTFNSAMRAFNKGQYRDAVQLYETSVDYVGRESRLGGQYELWHAQALDAAGDKGRAAKMLESLRTHADTEVRKVSRELLFIITAPKLELEPGTFLSIPALEDDSRPSRMPQVLTSSFGPLKTALLEKRPEPHTLEWYMERERPPRVADNSRMEAVMLATVIGFTVAFVLASHPI